MAPAWPPGFSFTPISFLCLGSHSSTSRTGVTRPGTGVAPDLRKGFRLFPSVHMDINLKAGM